MSPQAQASPVTEGLMLTLFVRPIGVTAIGLPVWARLVSPLTSIVTLLVIAVAILLAAAHGAMLTNCAANGGAGCPATWPATPPADCPQQRHLRDASVPPRERVNTNLLYVARPLCRST